MADPEVPEADPRDAKIANLESTLSRMEATLGALAKGSQAPQAPPTQAQQRAWVKGADIPLPLRQHILSQGLSEADLEANAPLVLPFVNAFLGAAASEFLTMLNGVRDDIKLIRMARDEESYPYLAKLEDDINSLRESGLKENRYYDPETAYRIAYARNEKKLKAESGEVTPAQVRSRDLSTQTKAASAGVRAMTAEEPKAPRSAADIQSMSKEERDAFWAANESTPVR